MQSTLERAIILATESHEGQTDKSGLPYILHPLAVMGKMVFMDERIVAVLHDVVEDTDVTLHDLITWGFDEEIVDAIDAITKRPGEKYMDYIKRADENAIARQVKIADIEHNLSRLDALMGDEKRRLRRKYTEAYSYLMCF